LIYGGSLSVISYICWEMFQIGDNCVKIDDDVYMSYNLNSWLIRFSIPF